MQLILSPCSFHLSQIVLYEWLPILQKEEIDEDDEDEDEYDEDVPVRSYRLPICNEHVCAK
jgi:hypothetical protein